MKKNLIKPIFGLKNFRPFFISEVDLLWTLQRFSEVTEQRGCNLFSPLDYFFNCHFQNFKKFGKWGLNVLTIYPANQNKNQQSKYLLVDFYFLLINTFLYQKTKKCKVLYALL